MISNHPIIDAGGNVIAPPQSFAERPAGPWDGNRAALRGREVREALAGETPTREAREASTIARMNATHPGASWHFVTHPTAGRVLVSVPNDDDDAIPASPEVLAEMAAGRRA